MLMPYRNYLLDTKLQSEGGVVYLTVCMIYTYAVGGEVATPYRTDNK